MPNRCWEAGEKYRYGFNGKENDDEVFDGDRFQDYGMRLYRPDLGRFVSVDPITAQYPMLTPFQFASNSPIAGIDLDGLEFYYAANGTFLYQGDDLCNTQVFMQKQTVINYVLAPAVSPNTDIGKIAGASSFTIEPVFVTENTLICEDHDVFVAFASTLDQEASINPTREEVFGLGNMTMNYLERGGSADLKTLDDIVMYANDYAYGSKQKYLTNFTTIGHDRNKKFAVGAVINALGFSLYGVQGGFKDYSNKADHWDGIDLVSKGKKWETQPHRKSAWTTSSKELLKEFSEQNNGVSVEGWKYKDGVPGLQAIKIEGGTLFQKAVGGQGEGKTSKRFTFELDHEKK